MTVDFLVLGAGVAGLAAGATLGSAATVLERDPRPGGLVRSFRLGDYWFDRVLHLLYLPDAATSDWIHILPDLPLAPCPPVAWVDTPHGTVQYPFQMHLAGLEPGLIRDCLRDLAAATYGPPGPAPANFEEHLLATFGRGLCEAFLFPYNRKMWRRPLASLAPSGFQWSITHPDYELVLLGALERDPGFVAYNAHGEYPRPPADSPLRGMECLSQALAAQVPDLRCGWEVIAIDPAARAVIAHHAGTDHTLTWHERLIATLPLPVLIDRCAGVPPELRREVAALAANRVWTAAYAVRGPRRERRGHWRYNSDESVSLTRVIYIDEFDPLAAPPEGYALMAEITERGDVPFPDPYALLTATEAELRQTGAIGHGDIVLDRTLVLAEPAYVVFTTHSQAVVREARAWLETQGIATVGRYGRWEYSSMGQVMRDARELALSLQHMTSSPVEAL